jgi:plastocyanin
VTPSASNASIAMTSSGVSPKQIQVSPGTRVQFTNNDSQTHEMASDPHPEHTDCPEINNVGFISPGQTKETGNLNTVRTCGYHDHSNPDDARFQGSIIIK